MRSLHLPSKRLHFGYSIHPGYSALLGMKHIVTVASTLLTILYIYRGPFKRIYASIDFVFTLQRIRDRHPSRVEIQLTVTYEPL